MESDIPPAATYMERARRMYAEEVAANENKRRQLLLTFQKIQSSVNK